MTRSRGLALFLLIGTSGCRDISRFSSHGDHFEGTVVKGSFVRSGIDENARMCLVLDTDHLQDTPGSVSTSDGRFAATPLRPIPQLQHDPLSTLKFGEGRVQNLVYAATPAGDTVDVIVVLSLMQTGAVEARVFRGAPEADGGAGSSVFGVFSLDRRDGACP